MTSLTLAAALQLSVITAGAHTYAEARATNLESGRPLVVLIGADWCPACKTMKDRALPQVEKGGLLDKVAFAYVDADEDSQLARKMMQGGSIPQLIMYRQTADGWKKESLVGAQSPGKIEAFLKKGIDAAVAENPKQSPTRLTSGQPKK